MSIFRRCNFRALIVATVIVLAIVFLPNLLRQVAGMSEGSQPVPTLTLEIQRDPETAVTVQVPFDAPNGVTLTTHSGVGVKITGDVTTGFVVKVCCDTEVMGFDDGWSVVPIEGRQEIINDEPSLQESVLDAPASGEMITQPQDSWRGTHFTAKQVRFMAVAIALFVTCLLISFGTGDEAVRRPRRRRNAPRRRVNAGNNKQAVLANRLKITLYQNSHSFYPLSVPLDGTQAASLARLRSEPVGDRQLSIYPLRANGVTW